MQAATFAGAVLGLVLGGCSGALLGVLIAWLGRSDKDRLPTWAEDRPRPQHRQTGWMWLLGGAVAIILLPPTALSLAWLTYKVPPAVPPTTAPAGPGPIVPGPREPQ